MSVPSPAADAAPPMASDERIPISAFDQPDRTMLIAAIRDHCAPLLGRHKVVADRSMPHGEAVVVELAAEDERRWIAKSILRPSRYRKELAALRTLAPILGEHAPQLIHQDDALRLIVMTRVPGEPMPADPAHQDPASYEQAGRLSRLLHDSAPPVAAPAYAAELTASLDRWAGAGSRAGLLSRAEIDFVADRIAELARLPPPMTVPCHLDYQPRNWLVDAAGVLRVIDFGAVGLDRWLQETSRMTHRQWRERPELGDAFYAGYGRRPTEEELHVQRCRDAHGALTTIVWAHEHDDPGFEAEGRRLLDELRAEG
ncbi:MULTISPECIES: aminoglycoside phosphotransferase family protein [Actinoalloteichus]|uniref:Phosphotransferase family protein n=1 Tax=Actinoalloteichus fjordicus TaxID=1612552 RepID=A0AAC9L8B5_9PSEU|nr:MULTISPECIES: aminoglycoside phosphotransferase family protein [Actinoalloteichus]APU13263.1 phosphotransferase family protein [Actinoalloteichus fjordicus]APU19214.1 phosphotransferase family protein [Actinoalloteichus sp. GBA129-24]